MAALLFTAAGAARFAQIRLIHKRVFWTITPPRQRARDTGLASVGDRTRKLQKLAMSGATDCCQPIEQKLQLTRRCLAALAEFRNPVSIVTKNSLVRRDLDLLRELAAHHAALVISSGFP